MAKKPLTIDSDFIVGEEKILNFILAALFAGFFVYGLINAIEMQKTRGIYNGYVCILFLVAAVYFLLKGLSKRIYIRINKTGIYHHGKLVTQWNNFLHAKIDQKKKLFTISDNFILVVEYLKAGEDKGFRRHLPLTNTQNKSEEDVLEAVRFFNNAYINSLSN